MIKISRGTNFNDKKRNYKVILDGSEIGFIEDNEIKSFEVEEGDHRIYLKIDWCKSNKLKIHVSKNECIEFECGNSLIGWKSHITILYVTILKNKYLWIKPKDKLSL